MRKPLFYLIVFVGGLSMQFGWSQYGTVHGYAPNLILVLIMFFSLLRGPMLGQVLGFAWGLSWDIFSVNLFGSHMFIYTCLGYFIGQLSKKWDENKISTQIVLVLLSSVFYWTNLAALCQLFGYSAVKVSASMTVQVFYNMLIAPVVFLGAKKIMDTLALYSSSRY